MGGGGGSSLGIVVFDEVFRDTFGGGLGAALVNSRRSASLRDVNR